MACERVAQAGLSGYLPSISTFWSSTLVAAMLVAIPPTSRAQGGPPMVTDDPDTPGDGHWENNLAMIATHTGGRWTLAVPDADLNYGWGRNVQLNADIPLTLVHDAGGGWAAGLGNVQLAVKWRFLEREDPGYTLSTYPRFTSVWIASSVPRGLADPGHSFLLPVEAATKVGAFALDAEVGRNFAVGTASQWQLGAIVAHACGRGIECMFELHQTLSAHQSQTLLNVGTHWNLSESLALIAAAGREFGPASPDQQRALVYLGAQLQR